MHQQLQELEIRFDRASCLLRVSAFVKHLKNQNMCAEVLRLIADTYNTLERAKTIANDITRLNSKPALKAEEHHQLYLFEDILKDLLNEIRAATKKLESETNVVRKRRTTSFSVIRDLDEATRAFNEIVAFGRRFNAM